MKLKRLLVAGILVVGMGQNVYVNAHASSGSTEECVAVAINELLNSKMVGPIIATLVVAPVVLVYTSWAGAKIKKYLGYKSDLDLTSDRLFAVLKARIQQIEELQRKLAYLEIQVKETRSKPLQQELNLVKAELALAQNHRNELLAEVAQEKDADGESCEACCH